MTAQIDQPEVPTTAPALERRGTPRHPLVQRCLVWPPGAVGADGWRCIAHNISPRGIGLSLPCPVRPGWQRWQNGPQRFSAFAKDRPRRGSGSPRGGLR